MGLILGMARGVPLWAWALAASLAWGGWQRHQVKAITAELMSQQAEAAQAREAALSESITETERRLVAQKGIVHEARKQAEKSRADAVAAAAAADRLRARLAAITSSARPVDSAASSGGPSAAESARVLAELLARADDRAGILARHADEARAAALACQRAYESLSE